VAVHQSKWFVIVSRVVKICTSIMLAIYRKVLCVQKTLDSSSLLLNDYDNSINTEFQLNSGICDGEVIFFLTEFTK
jgi:hypothetical protein